MQSGVGTTFIASMNETMTFVQLLIHPQSLQCLFFRGPQNAALLRHIALCSEAKGFDQVEGDLLCFPPRALPPRTLPLPKGFDPFRAFPGLQLCVGRVPFSRFGRDEPRRGEIRGA